MKLKTTMTAAVLAMTFGMSANAANIALTDPSFETGFSGTFGSTVSGWNTFGNAVAAIDVSTGFWSISNFHGTNALYATSTSTSDGGSVYQTVELDAGVEYVFTASVAQAASVGKNDANYALVFFSDGFATLHAETTGIVVNQSGIFVDDSVSFTPTVSGKYNVGVRNRGHITGTGANNNESTVFFDNARLDVVPEPSTTALLGLGGLALILRRRK